MMLKTSYLQIKAPKKGHQLLFVDGLFSHLLEVIPSCF